MYPDGTPARVPLVSVTGTNGKTTTVRMIAHMLDRTAGGRHDQTEGVYLGGHLVHRADASGPRSAQMVLGDRSSRRPCWRPRAAGSSGAGLGYDCADVAVVTNVTADHLGSTTSRRWTTSSTIKSLVAEEIRAGGHVVLNADDPASRASPSARGPRAQPGSALLRPPSSATPSSPRHLRRGGAAYSVKDGWLIEARGDAGPARSSRPPTSRAPSTASPPRDRQRARRGRRRPRPRRAGELVARGLRSFDPHRCNPGRGCSFRIEDTPSWSTTPTTRRRSGPWARSSAVWGGVGVAAVTLPGDRSDDLVIDTARELAGSFDRVVVYEDEDLRGRRSGEMTRLIVQGLPTHGRTCEPPAGDLKDALTSRWASRRPASPSSCSTRSCSPSPTCSRRSAPPACARRPSKGPAERPASGPQGVRAGTGRRPALESGLER